MNIHFYFSLKLLLFALAMTARKLMYVHTYKNEDMSLFHKIREYKIVITKFKYFDSVKINAIKKPPNR